jgi:hypothetical protein
VQAGKFERWLARILPDSIPHLKSPARFVGDVGFPVPSGIDACSVAAKDRHQGDNHRSDACECCRAKAPSSGPSPDLSGSECDTHRI